MQKLFETLTNSFRKKGGELDFLSFEKILRKSSPFIDDIDTMFLLLQASGYPIEEKVWGYKFKNILYHTKNRSILLLIQKQMVLSLYAHK